MKSWLIVKDSEAGRDWGQEEKGTTEDEMAGWHHWLNGCESEWTPGVGDGQGGLVCCNSWGRKESDTTERLNWTEYKHFPHSITYEHIAELWGVEWRTGKRWIEVSCTPLLMETGSPYPSLPHCKERQELAYTQVGARTTSSFLNIRNSNYPGTD